MHVCEDPSLPDLHSTDHVSLGKQVCMMCKQIYNSIYPAVDSITE